MTPPPRLYGGRYNMRIGEIFRPRTGFGKNTSDQPIEHPIGITQLKRLDLSRQQRIDHLVATCPAVKFRPESP